MLRKKIDADHPVKLIQTVRGTGYTLRVPEQNARQTEGRPDESADVSLRRQLILWNILTLTALLTALGLVTRFAATSAILHSVDQHLADCVHAPPPGDHFGNRHPAGAARWRLSGRSQSQDDFPGRSATGAAPRQCP